MRHFENLGCGYCLKKAVDHAFDHLPTGATLIGTLMWFADDNESGFVTGTVIPVDGGFSAYGGV